MANRQYIPCEYTVCYLFIKAERWWVVLLRLRFRRIEDYLSLFFACKKETNYQKSSIEMKKDVNKTIKEKRHNKTDVYDAKF